RAKRRGRDLPLPVLVHTWRQAIGLVEEIPDQAQALIAAWWAGPLTLVLRETPGIGWDLGESRGTVAVRMPKQDFALALIQRTGPLAVSSANRSGEPTPNEIPAVVEQLGDDVGVFFDAGPASEAPASSIVDLTGRRPPRARAGGTPRAAPVGARPPRRGAGARARGALRRCHLTTVAARPARSACCSSAPATSAGRPLPRPWPAASGRASPRA